MCFVIALASLGSLLVSGCAPSHPTERIIVAVDRSGSTDAFRETQLTELDDCSDEAVAKNAELDIWCYDSTAVRVYGPQIPSGDDTPITIVKRDEMIPNPRHLRRGTRPANLLDSIIDSISAPSTPTRVRIVLLTDGDNEYANDTSRIGKDINELGARAATSIAVIDVTPANNAHWTNLLKTAFGKHFVVAGAPVGDSATINFLNN